MLKLDSRFGGWMRAPFHFCLLLFLLANISGCGSNPVTMQYDENYDFDTIQRYTFVSRDRMQANFLLSDVQRNRIEYVIEQQLDQRGLRYVRNAADADVLIAYTVINHHRLIAGKQYEYCEFCNARAMTNSPGQSQARNRQRDGTLVISMLESHSKRRIWQVALAANLLQKGRNELDKERLEQTVAELFTQWPVTLQETN